MFVLFNFVLIREKHPRVLRSCFLLVAIFLGYSALFLLFTEHPVERAHLFEYGFLSFLTYQALTNTVKGKKVYGWGMTMVMVVSILDELYQGFLPQRFGDIRDVLLNGFSGLFGFALLAILMKPSKGSMN